jgi:hypothetical protein
MTAILRLFQRRAIRLSPFGGITGYVRGKPVVRFGTNIEMAIAWRDGEL